jgi:ubiquinone/menaquinone biosynthesis C-methylase UbiE
MTVVVNDNEHKVAAAFSKQSNVFDQLYSSNPIIQYKRQRTRQAVLKQLNPGDTILELNTGTGEDAIYFAQKGFRVHATDLSDGMLKILSDKKDSLPIAEKITVEKCSFTDLDLLKNKGPFDHIFSNFGGLNCTGDLARVLASLKPLVKPGGGITLIIIPPFCLWETLLIFKGRFKTGTRRFFSRNGRSATIEGEKFTCWYYSAAYIKKHLAENFEIVSLEGLCAIVPPSYLETFPSKYPRLFSFLKKWEDRLCDKWPFRSLGDYFIISLKKKED